MRTFVLLTALLIGLVTPAWAADDVATAQGVITSQVEALGRNDAATAYSFAAPAIQSTSEGTSGANAMPYCICVPYCPSRSISAGACT